MKIYLLRHGETLWNQEGRMQGHRDVPLSEEGLKQVAEAAGKVANLKEPMEAILSSPLKRARVTAETVAEAIGYPKEKIILCPELIERGFGEAEGSTPEERQEKYPDGIYPGMETPEELCERAGRVLEECLERFPGRTILLVSHGMFLKALLAVAAGADFEKGDVPIVGPASLNLLEYTDGKFTLWIDETRDRWFR